MDIPSWLGCLFHRFIEAPAATLHQYGKLARDEVEPDLRNERSHKNASRDTHAFIRRWGLSWKVPLSYVEVDQNGEHIKFAFLKPSNFIKYLINTAPELLMGGCSNIEDGQAHLKTFWDCYRPTHPTHRLFRDEHQTRTLSTTVPIAFHGDEGRGLKKGNTTILMMEACLGVDTWAKWYDRRSALSCDDCEIDGPTRKKIRTDSGKTSSSTSSLACFQTTNLKEHSFLTKFVLAALPKKEKALVDAVLLEIVRDFNTLFDEGVSARGCQWFVACTGAKGDLKWVQRVADLNRSFGSQISINKKMCHECLAGDQEFPFEDASDHPSWAPTCYTKRPYACRPVVCHIPFEHQDGNDEAPHERIFRRDIFHNTKMGVFRMFVASCVMLLAKLHYFDQQGQSNGRPLLIERAYHHFRYFCSTTSRTPALRSFSLSFFNSPSWFTFPWVNCKGSDTSHLLAWVHTMVVGFANDPLKQEHSELLKRMALTASAARNFQKLCYSHGLWLDKARCGACLYKEMNAFARGYNACAFLSMHQFQFTGFAMTSKYHLICHAKLDILNLLENKDAFWIPNPQTYGCEMNEDVVGKMSRLIRRVDARRASSRALELYLTKSKAVHRRFLLKQKKHQTKPSQLKAACVPLGVPGKRFANRCKG